jgi:hypothetical protein
LSWLIRNWNDHYEDHKTRQLKKLDWVRMPNKMDGSGYTELLDHPNGAAHFGAWCALVEMASKGAPPRGNLSRSAGSPTGNAGYAPESAGYATDIARLSRICRIPQSVLLEAIDRLLHIGWLELINDPENNHMAHPAGLPPDNAGQVKENAGLPPKSAADPAPSRAGAERNGTERNRREGKGREGKGTDDEHFAAGTSTPPPPAENPSSSDFDFKLPDKGIERNISPNPTGPVGPQVLTANRIDRMRAELMGYMTIDAKAPPAPPDDGIVLQCLTAVGDTDLGTVHAFLHEARNVKDQAPHRPRGPRAYTWFPAVLRNHFQSTASDEVPQ